jgi:lysophospholipase L1-like esterase
MKTTARRLWLWAELSAGCAWLGGVLVLRGWHNPSGVWLAALLAAGVVLAGSWAFRLAVRPPRWRVLLVASAAVVPLMLVAGIPTTLLTDVDSLTRVRVVETLGLEGLAGNTAARPVPHAPEEHERLLQVTQRGTGGVVFLGDSLTSRWATAGKATWDRLFAPLDAVNFGVGEDRVENVLWRVRNGALDGLHPRAVVLLIGTNNLGHNTAGQLTEGLSLLLGEIRQRQPRAAVLLLGLLPRARAASSPMRGRIGEVNRRLADLADGQRVHFRDVGGVLLEEDGTLSAAVAPDELHLSAEGYRRLGEAIGPELASLRAGQRAARPAALSR